MPRWAIGLIIAGVFLIGIVFMVFKIRSMMAVECEICVEFNGRRNCATAAGPDEMQAWRSAQSTACATIAGGMTEGIECDRTPPAVKNCRAR